MSKKTPQIRFKGFTDDWEERKFFESMASTIDFRGRTPKKLGMDWSSVKSFSQKDFTNLCNCSFLIRP